MSTERSCFFAKPKRKLLTLRKGCKKPAKYRVIIGAGLTIDVCEEHMEQYRLIGMEIRELKKLEVET